MQCRLAGDVASIAEALDQLKHDCRRLGISAANEAAELRKTVVDSLEGVTSRYDTPTTTDSDEPFASIQLPSNLRLWLSRLSTAGAQLPKQISIIDSLYFPQILRREESIKEAHPTTFEWLFEEACPTESPKNSPKTLDWLRNGRGAFWISGRAGSGKSTLMKFFYHHPKTTAALKQWAGSRRLFVASFFSWNAGTMMQKSQQGLLQTLLYHILRQDPALIPSVCPSRWSSTSLPPDTWSHAEVLEAFTKLKEQDLRSVRHCFFIDGLDEFDGDHPDIISTINTFASSDAIKICFSSRPWAVFESAYGTNHGLMIRLQDLTRSDIRSFVEDRLAEGTQFVRLKSTDPAYESLIHEILERSNGVFLWVYLVVRSLRRGMTKYDTISELQMRLRELPSELEDYFQHMLDSTERMYHRQAARLYLLRLVIPNELTVFDVSMFADDNPDFALNDDLASDIQSYSQTSVKTTKSRILVRCQDLLEIDRDAKLHFLHRTVKDFLETKDLRTLLDRRAGLDFSPHHFMCNSMLLRMRQIAEFPGYFTQVEDASVEYIFYAAIKTFFSHACSMEIQLDYRLFPMLDRTVWKMLSSLNGMARDALFGFGATQYEGWLADKAAKHSLEGFLLHNIDAGIEVLSKDGHSIRKPRLDVALRSMASPDKYQIVKRLLDAGADPNETIQSADGFHVSMTVWQAYISSRERLSKDCEIHKIAIIEMLLLRGADPSIGGSDENFFSRSLPTGFGIFHEEVAKLEALRRSLLPTRSEQHRTVGNWTSELPSHVRGHLPMSSLSSKIRNESAKRAHVSNAKPGEESQRVLRTVRKESNLQRETHSAFLTLS